MTSIPPRFRPLFRKVSDLSERRGEPAYVVGGYVRDLILGVHSFDVDFAVEGDGPAFARDLASAVGGRCEAFTRFGTAIVVVPGFGKVDVASTRAESYARAGALPDVAPAPLAADLARRDFTLNSIALRLRPGGRADWVDPTGGREDLKKRILRAHHERTFEDDPTRVFRAVRFEQRFAFHIEPCTLGWLKAAVKRGFLSRVSGERIRNEIRLIFAEPRPERAVGRLEALGVWSRLHPRLGPSAAVKDVAASLKAYSRFDGAIEEPWMVWFASLAGRLTAAERRALAGRLALSGAERKILFQCGGPVSSALAKMRSGSATLGMVHDALAGLRGEARERLWMRLTASGRRLLLRYEKASAGLRPFLSGKDLIALGLKPGPAFAGILGDSARLQIDGRLKNRKEALNWLGKTVELVGKNS